MTPRSLTFAVSALSLGVIGCGDTTEPRSPSSSSSTLTLDEVAGRLWVTAPDHDAVVAIDTTTLGVIERIEVPGAPEQLARSGTTLVVTRARSSSVAVIELVSGDPVLRDVPTRCGGTRAVALSSPTTAWISCPHDDLILELDLTSATITRSVPSPGRPTALAVSGSALAVTAARIGALILRDLDDPATILEQRNYRASPGVSASQLDVLAASQSIDGFVAAYQLVDHDADRSRDPALGGYGAVVDDRPRISPRIAAHGCAAEYARFNGGPRVASGPSALAHADGKLWIAHRYTDNVLVLDCAIDGPLESAPTAVDGSATLRAAFRTGRGPRGLALSSDGRTAFVDVGFDHAVARLELDDASPPATPREPALARRRDLGPSRLSAAAATGRASFFDATNTHLTPSGIVTCGTCHPDGGEDGLTWFLHTRQVARKLRRTPPASGAARALAPFHWDGEFTDAGVLTRAAIVALMEGDGLVVDVDAIADYLGSIEPPFPRPIVDRARWGEGRALFDAAGCATCHPPPALADGRAHAVLAPSADPDGTLDVADTPSLRGVRARPPYLHDGRAATLADVITRHNGGDLHGRTSTLTPDQVIALVDYLESL